MTASIEERRKAYAEPIARAVQARRDLVAALTEIITVGGTPFPGAALLLEALGTEQPTGLDLAVALRVIPNARQRAQEIQKLFNGGVTINVTGPSGTMTPEQVTSILLETFDVNEPRRRQAAADAPISAALVAAAEAERASERELTAARKWKFDQMAKREHASRARGDVLDDARAREDAKRSREEKHAAEEAELDEYRAAILAGTVPPQPQELR